MELWGERRGVEEVEDAQQRKKEARGRRTLFSKSTCRMRGCQVPRGFIFCTGRCSEGMPSTLRSASERQSA